MNDHDDKIRLIQKNFREIILLKKDNIRLFDHIKNVLFKMLNNLSSIQQKNILTETPNHYNLILNKVKLLVNQFKNLPSDMKLKNNMYQIRTKLLFLRNDVMETINHLSPKKFSDIMKFLIHNYYYSYFEDQEMLDFINRVFCGFMVWDSKYHSKEIKLIESPKSSNKSIQKFMGNKMNFSHILNKITNSNKNVINNNYRKNSWFINDFRDKFENTQIFFDKNKYANSLFEELYGVALCLKIYDRFIIIQGYLQDDVLDIMKDHPIIKDKLTKIKNFINANNYNIEINFKNNFINILSLKDILTFSCEEIYFKLKTQYDDYKILITKPLLVLVNDFLLASKNRKKDILISLLLSSDENKKLASVLFDTLKQQSKTTLAQQIYQGIPIILRTELDTQIKQQEENEEKLLTISENDISFEKRIMMLKADENVKNKAIEKLKSIKNNLQGDNKASTWLEGLLKIPFNIYRDSPILTFKNQFIKSIYNKYQVKLNSDKDISDFIKSKNDIKMIDSWNQYKLDSKKYLGDVRATLDKAVYGHYDAKLQIERIIAQWINGHTNGAVLGLQGPPGTGKTSLAIKGLSKCLIDADGTHRPFAFLPIGGSSNGSTLVGHNYTYVGSTWGRIVDILITTKCMNPIIFIDEIDKVSHTEHGREIISILTHLTDPTQNHEFEDKYFSGIKFDLSKALIVFSFNDISLIDPILRDRITIIDTHPLTLPEKITISKNFIIPEILNEIGFGTNEIIFSDEIITFLINTYTYEAGVRKIKEKYYEIIREINLQQLYQNDNFQMPFYVSKEFIEKLFIKKPKVRIKTIHYEPAVGLVNGLYATSAGIGGLTVIQVIKHACDKNLEISMTGKQGEVMQESVNYAFKIAFGLLPFDKQQELINQKEKFGLHIHTPDAATPKDGPSAGAAITLAFYSILTNQKVDNKVAMTGEIDLLQNVTAIGGLESKLLGAKKAGATKVLIPQENYQDLERIRNDGISPEDDNFKVIPVSHFSQVLLESIIKK